MDYLLLSVVILLIAALMMEHRQHKQDMDELNAMFHEEREKLLDRIMANNIHEYKAASGVQNVQRSDTGNFLKDRMTETIRKQFTE